MFQRIAKPFRISIHALLAESDLRVLDGSKSSIISIHALLAESDRKAFSIFLPIRISIHALLAESDLAVAFMTCPPPDFYPRSPCGERPARPTANNATTKFLSTLSLRRATPQDLIAKELALAFLSTLSLRRATLCLLISALWMAHFYPRSPCGERRFTVSLR